MKDSERDALLLAMAAQLVAIGEAGCANGNQRDFQLEQRTFDLRVMTQQLLRREG